MIEKLLLFILALTFAVTFNTLALYDKVKEGIETFVREL